MKRYFFLEDGGGGGAMGVMEGWREAAHPSFKIRMNSVMNAVSRRGSKAGNTLAVVACLHTGFTWLIEQMELDRYTRGALLRSLLEIFAIGQHGITYGAGYWLLLVIGY